MSEIYYTYYTWGNKIGVLVFSSKGLLYHLLPSPKSEVNGWIKEKFTQARFRKRAGALLKRQLDAYFAGEMASFKTDLDWSRCTPFQRRVYKKLRQIPYGKTCFYQWLAESVGVPGGARAVGLALKYNPFPLFVPCHRVIRKDGSLGGFNCGLEWKKRLLEIESCLDAESGVKIFTPNC